MQNQYRKKNILRASEYQRKRLFYFIKADDIGYISSTLTNLI